MAQVDVKWPSEEEEFDATADSAGAPTENNATKVAVTEASSAPDPESVVTPTPNDESSIVSEAAAEPEAETAPEPETQITPDSSSEPEQESKPIEEATTAPEIPAEPEAVDPTTSETEESPAAPEESAVERTPETSSEPETAPEPEAGKDTDSSSDKAQQAPTIGSTGHHTGRFILIGVLILIIAGLGLYAWTLQSDRNNLQAQLDQIKANPQNEVQRQVDQIVASVGKITMLPVNETPTISTVTDVAAAQKQSAFFATAKNGDKVLVYVKAGKAILYRPSTNKIILTTPLTLDNSPTGSSTPAASSSTSTTKTKATQ